MLPTVCELTHFGPLHGMGGHCITHLCQRRRSRLGSDISGNRLLEPADVRDSLDSEARFLDIVSDVTFMTN